MIINEDFFDDVDNSEIVSTEENPEYEDKKYTHRISISYPFNMTWLNMNKEYIVQFVRRLTHVINNLTFIEDNQPLVFGTKHSGYYSKSKVPFDFGDTITSTNVETLMKMEGGTEITLTVVYLININKVGFKRFCSDMHNLYMVSTYNNKIRSSYMVSFEETEPEDKKFNIHGLASSDTMWSQESVKDIYKFLYKEEYVSTSFNDSRYEKLFKNQTSKIKYLYYLHQIDKRVQIFIKDFIVDIYAVKWIPSKNNRTLDVYMTVAPMNDDHNKTGDIVDFVYKKFAKALKDKDWGEFVDEVAKHGTVNFFVYTNPNIEPSKSVYTGETIDVKSDNKKVTFEEDAPTMNFKYTKYIYNIEFVDKNWNMTEDELYDFEKYHNKWKNMKF